MRIYTNGFEGYSLEWDDLFNSGYLIYSSIYARKDLFGNGGSYCIFCGDPPPDRYLRTKKTFQEYMNFTTAPKEFWIRFGMRASRSTTDFMYLIPMDDVGSEIFCLKIGQQSIELRDTFVGTLVDSTTNHLDVGTLASWHLVEVNVYLHSSSGFIKVYFNGELTPTYSFSGNTARSSSNGFSVFKFKPEFYMDDLAINTPTMLYDTGTGGTPVVGNTLTGGTSGATAIIEGYDGTAVSGRLFLSLVSGSFADNETITDTGTFSAAVNAPTASFANGLEPQSDRPGNGYTVKIIPNGDSSAGLTGSDGDSINNYALVNTQNTTTYVGTTTVGLEDKYNMTSFSDLGFTSTEVNYINAVSINSYAAGEGTINTIMNNSLTISAVTYYGIDNILYPSLSRKKESWSYSPATNQELTPTEIDNLIVGTKFKA